MEILIESSHSTLDDFKRKLAKANLYKPNISIYMLTLTEHPVVNLN